MLIKARYIKDGKQKGKEYTFSSDEKVSIGEEIMVGNATAVVTSVDVSEEEVSSYKDKLKKANKKVEEE